MSCGQHRMVGGEFPAGKDLRWCYPRGGAGERRLKSTVADSETFPVEHLPHCLSSSESLEGLGP